ncbi:MAG: glycogen debranching protein GlgX [Microbacteriaceae bacterium]
MLDPSNPSPPTRLGVTVTDSGGELRVWSANATSIDVCFFDEKDANWMTERVPLALTEDGIWFVSSPLLSPGTSYSLRAGGPEGPTHYFDQSVDLIDPYATGLERTPSGEWRSYVQDESFDWQGVSKPQIAADHVVLYEAHVKGVSKLNPDVPEDLRGTYAGFGHEATIAYLTNLGVTSVQLLPVHQSVSEQRLIKQGLTNYWGYNTLNFFTPHSEYATAAAQTGGAGAVLREFKEMVRSLHAAGIQVILDVVYNHTAEEGPTGPTTSLRGLDNDSYYRNNEDGSYIDVTGCGNTVDFSVDAAHKLVLDSLEYWFNDVQVDGFRFDLMATLGRDENVNFQSEHPLLRAILEHPRLQGAHMIAEPWDVGMGGWQVGNFPAGYSEWNDGFRDRVRDFWLTDIGAARANDIAPNGIGSLARRLAGSAHVFAAERGPLASVNFITAHDGFTMADLTSYYTKHNLGNGEHNRDGTNNNRSFNHGHEGPSTDPVILAARYKAMRNLLGTLLLSAGTPMLTAGDEWGRTQRGNNNAYCHDSELTWLHWQHSEWQNDLFEVARTLIRLRRDNPALRPRHFGRFGETVPNATQMDWYNKEGLQMTEDDWDSAAERTLQYLAASTPEHEEFNRILLVVHGLEDDVTVTLPAHNDVSSYTLLWDSAAPGVSESSPEHAPGTELTISGTSMQLFRAH